MDYEKKYKEALERAKRLHSEPTGGTERIVCEQIFPELKESEDEKIRKELIGFLRNIPNSNYTCEEMAHWLEKQGEQKQDPCDNCKDVMLNCHNFPCIKKRAFKQGKSVLEVINEEKVDNATDKIEPKFHAGDFITDGKRVFQIEETVWERNNRSDYTTYCESLIVNLRDGLTYANNTNLKEYHLWTIQDAKDGDVLVNGSNIFIFSHLSDTRAMGYCHINIDDGRFYDDKGKNECFGLIDAVFSPATKEQRDTLMKAMTDAGYAFDFDKKELKKIDNETEIPYGSKDSELQEAIYFIPKGFHAEIDDDKAVIKEGEKPTAWSEMDKAMTRWITSDLELLKNRGDGGHESEIKWLKSLKDRYAWQPSDEQMEAFEHFVKSIGESGYASPYANNTKLLYSLLEQLKKLK